MSYGTYSLNLMNEFIQNGNWINYSYYNNFPGELITCGLNNTGQLGTGDSNPYNSPVILGYNYIQVSCSNNITAIIDSNNNLWTCGNNNYGQLGIGNYINQNTYVKVQGSWLYVDCTANLYTLAIKTDNTLWSCGYNNGSLGINGNNGISINSFVQIPGSWLSVSSKSAVLAIDSNKYLWTWGPTGITGIGTKYIPTKINTNKFLSCSTSGCGNNYAAIDTNNHLWTCGSNTYGQLGTNNTTYYSVPQLLSGTWNQVISESYALFAIDTNNRLWVCGYGYNGQLGTGDTLNRSSLTQIPGIWLSVYNMNFYTTAIDINYNLWAWGGCTNDYFYNSGKTFSSNIPVIISNINWLEFKTSNYVRMGRSINFKKVLSPSQQTLTPLQLWSVGNFNYNMSYNNTTALSQRIGSSLYTSICAGPVCSAAIDVNKNLWVMGTNSHGQLGTGDTTDRSTITQIGTKTWNSVSMSYDTTYAIDTDGHLWVAGAQAGSVLGIGAASYSTFTQIGSKLWLYVSAPKGNGDPSLFAIDNNYNLYTANAAYMGGANSTTLTQLGSKFWKSIICNASRNIMAIDSIGHLWASGPNSRGQLGTGDTTDTSSLVQIGSNTWSMVCNSYDNGLNDPGMSAGIDSNQFLWTWGANNNGQLALNDNIDRSVPTKVGSNRWLIVTEHAPGLLLAIDTGNNLYYSGNPYGGLPGYGTTNYLVQIGPSGVWNDIKSTGGGGTPFYAPVLGLRSS